MSTSTIDYDPFTAGLDDPYEDYRRLRDEQPLYHSARYGFYAVSRYEDVRMVSRDWQTFSSAEGVDVDHTALLGGPNFLECDPPDHDWWRRLFQPRFSAKAIRESLWPVIEAEVARLLDAALADGREEVDLAAEVAWQLPIAVTGHMMGVPKADQPALSENLRLFQERDPGDITPPPHSVKAAADAHEYLIDLIEERRANLGDDLLSLMLTAEHDGEPLPEDHILGNAFFFLDAGTHTTSSLISQALLLLDANRDQRRWLLEDRDRVPGAVEEALRYEAPLRFLRRVTTKECELHGETVPAGATIFMLYCAANRDDRRWRDADVFDATRKQERNIGLGEGIHHCMGAPIARFEATIALGAILDRLPDYEVSGVPERLRSHMMNGYTSIPVAAGR
ncbi:MAG: cytochrome P450 [Actinobacteria bacterium]|nr:cytochrome P450 [Actinomycetota bacterium]